MSKYPEGIIHFTWLSLACAAGIIAVLDGLDARGYLPQSLSGGFDLWGVTSETPDAAVQAVVWGSIGALLTGIGDWLTASILTDRELE